LFLTAKSAPVQDSERAFQNSWEKAAKKNQKAKTFRVTYAICEIAAGGETGRRNLFFCLRSLGAL
jgi:hypothetical protein